MVDAITSIPADPLLLQGAIASTTGSEEGSSWKDDGKRFCPCNIPVHLVGGFNPIEKY